MINFKIFKRTTPVNRVDIPHLVLEQLGAVLLITWLTFFYAAISFIIALLSRSFFEAFP